VLAISVAAFASAENNFLGMPASLKRQDAPNRDRAKLSPPAALIPEINGDPRVIGDAG